MFRVFINIFPMFFQPSLCILRPPDIDRDLCFSCMHLSISTDFGNLADFEWQNVKRDFLFTWIISRRNMELEQVTLKTCNLCPDAQGQTLLYSCYYPGVTTSRLLQLRTISSYHGGSPCCGNGNHITSLVETRYYIRMFPVAHCIWQEFLIVA